MDVAILFIEGFWNTASTVRKFDNVIFVPFQSSNPPFTSVELDHSDSGREGCTVTTLTVTAEPKNWQNAVKVAVQEVYFLLSALIYPHCEYCCSLFGWTDHLDLMTNGFVEEMGYWNVKAICHFFFSYENFFSYV